MERHCLSGDNERATVCSFNLQTHQLVGDQPTPSLTNLPKVGQGTKLVKAVRCDCSFWRFTKQPSSPPAYEIRRILGKRDLLAWLRMGNSVLPSADSSSDTFAKSLTDLQQLPLPSLSAED